MTEAEASVIWLQGPRFSPLFNRAALINKAELLGRVKSDDKSSMYCMHAKGSVAYGIPDAAPSQSSVCAAEADLFTGGRYPNANCSAVYPHAFMSARKSCRRTV